MNLIKRIILKLFFVKVPPLEGVYGVPSYESYIEAQSVINVLYTAALNAAASLKKIELEKHCFGLKNELNQKIYGNIIYNNGGNNMEDLLKNITLRDWFAGQAMSGINANPDYDLTPDFMARESYKLADAMMAERERGES